MLQAFGGGSLFFGKDRGGVGRKMGKVAFGPEKWRFAALLRQIGYKKRHNCKTAKK